MPETSEATTGHARFEVLDGMRGIAAISVMVYHFTQNGSHPLMLNASLAVDLFFMLSGFVIAHSYGGRLQKDMSYFEYICKRFIRLYPMYILGIVIGTPILYFLAKAGLATCSERLILSGLIYNSFFIPDINSFGIQNIGMADGNFGFGEYFPMNPPSWSLFFEMVASFSFPFLFRLKRRALIKTIVCCFAAVLLFGAVDAFLDYRYAFDPDMGWGSPNFFGGFPRVFFGFSFGILIYSLANDGSFGKLQAFAGRFIKSPYLLYLLLILVFAFPRAVKGLYPALILAVVAPTLIFIGSTIRCEGDISRKTAKFLGWISYPIYCLHFPIGRVAFWMADGAHRSEMTTILASIAGSLVAAIILTKIYEEPVRAAFSRKLSRYLTHSPVS